jgi:hypothetical protein
MPLVVRAFLASDIAIRLTLELLVPGVPRFKAGAPVHGLEPEHPVDLPELQLDVRFRVHHSNLTSFQGRDHYLGAGGSVDFGSDLEALLGSCA